MYYPQGWRKHLPKAVKRTVPLPVVSVALIRDPAYGEKLLEEGVLDFVASARSHLADPDWGNKARQGDVYKRQAQRAERMFSPPFVGRGTLVYIQK